MTYEVYTADEADYGYVSGSLIGTIDWSDDDGDNGDLAEAIAEKFADELGEMKWASWLDDEQLGDENGRPRAMVYEVSEA